MQAYTGFAQVYDIFMDNVPYSEWADYLTNLLVEHGVEDGLVLELGCGTGNITRKLSAKGYDMIGIDNSEEMLEIARDREYDNTFEDENEEQDQEEQDQEEQTQEEQTQEEQDQESVKNNSILYLQQDMRNFELYGTVTAVVSICDSMNYITSNQDLLKVFKLVNNYLDTDGIFIFDMNTEYKYKHILADNTIAENRDDCSFIWENYYDEDKMLNEYNLTVYVKLEDDDSDQEDQEDQEVQLFERFEETHYQKAYSLDTVKKLLEEADMEFITVYDAFTHNPPTEKSERIYFVAREKHQMNKKYI